MVLCLVLAAVDYRLIVSSSLVWYGFGMVLLLAVAIIGTTVHGGQRWLPIGGFRLQPSEFMKIALIVALASYLGSRREEPWRFRYLVLSAGIVAIPVGLVYLQPDLGTALVLIAIWGVVLFASGVSLKQVAMLAVLAGASLPLIWMNLHGYMRDRVTAFIGQNPDPEITYAVDQALISIGSGSIWGKGYASGTQSQLHFLRVRHTDFIFSVLSEELGFVGAMVTLALLAFICWRMMRIGLQASDGAGAILGSRRRYHDRLPNDRQCRHERRHTSRHRPAAAVRQRRRHRDPGPVPRHWAGTERRRAQRPPPHLTAPLRRHPEPGECRRGWHSTCRLPCFARHRPPRVGCRRRRSAGMAELMTQVEQMAVVDGVKLDSVSNILVGERVAKLPFAKARGRLYVLVEPIGDRTGWGGLSREIAQSVHDEYYDGGGSVTAGLRRALERANQLLCDMNSAESRRAPRLAGLTAVVLKGADVFIAETGPALVYVVHGSHAARFPEDSPWLDMSPRQAMEDGYAPPLGLRPDLSVDLFHYQVEPGDTIVLAESSVAQMVDEQEAAVLFGKEGDAASDARLQSLFQDKDVSLVVVRVDGADEGLVEPRRVQRLSAFQPAVPEPGPVSPAEALEAGGSGPRDMLRNLGGLVAYCGAKASEIGRVVWRRMLPGSERSRLARQGRRQVGGLTLMQKGTRPVSDGRLMLLGMLAGLAVIIAVAYGLVHWQTGRMQANRYQRTVTSVQAKLEEARQATDPAAAKVALVEADVLLARAAEMPQAGQDTQELSRQLGEQLDTLDSVVRLYWLPVLRQYTEAGTSPARVVSHGIDSYVLDAGLGRVYKYLFNPMMDGFQELGEGVPEVLLRTGDEREGVTVGRLVDMTWMPPGPGREWGSLLVLDASGALLEYEPSSGIKVLPAGPRATAQVPREIAGIEGRLLMLDAGANQIQVFEPGNGAYEGAGVAYTNADLLMGGVVDMAVDGDVYLLYADGMVAKLRAGEQIEFELSGMDTRIVNPTAMCVTAAVGENPGYVYIADAGNQRIVQLTKDGQFVRQLKPKRGEESFRDIRSLSVDEEAGKVQILTGTGLLLANLPR